MTSVAAGDMLQRAAEILRNAEQDRVPVEPISDTWPQLSLADAYRIQRVNIDRRMGAGERLVGHKIGLTARPMQEKFGVNEPDYGHLLASMQLTRGEPLRLGELVDPQVEVEPAFVLRRPLRGPGVTVEDVLDATEYVTTCFEIIDSRIRDWRIQLADTVADNGSSARFVLGEERVDPASVQLDNLDTGLELDGRCVERGNTHAVLGHPARGIVWLADTLGGFGVTLEAGHVVLPGTCIRCHRIAGARRARGWIEGLGDVSVDLEGLPAITHND